MIEYLTLQQTAYLLGLSAYNVRYMIFKNVFHAVAEVRGKRTLYFIRADEIWCYVTEQMCQYSKAIEYFECEDRYAFWQKYEEDFKTNWIEKYKERNQRYYDKRKIQNQMVEQIKQEEREKEHQEILKERYDIEEDVVVVEKKQYNKIFAENIAWRLAIGYRDCCFYPGTHRINGTDLSGLKRRANPPGTAGVAGFYKTVIKGMQR